MSNKYTYSSQPDVYVYSCYGAQRLQIHFSAGLQRCGDSVGGARRGLRAVVSRFSVDTHGTMSDILATLCGSHRITLR